MRARITWPSFATWLRFGAAYVALNAPHWLLGHWFYISRPIFNLELMIPLLVAAWSVPVASLTLVVVWGLDLTVSQARSYHFTSPLEFLRSAQFLSEIHVGQFLSTERLLLGLLFAIPATMALRAMSRRQAPWLPAIALAAILATLDIVNGSSVVSHRGTQVVPTNIANSPTTTLALRAWNERQQPPLVALPDGASATSIAGVGSWASAHPDGSVLIVVVESMGWHVDARLREWLRAQLYDGSLEPRYALRDASVPFRGSTTAAELRELCGLYGSYRSLDANAGAACLPARLAGQGWTTVGMHGFSSHMFDREDWWPLIGLDVRRFGQDLVSPDAERCGGAFAGVCDAALMSAALAEARSPRRFVYALTLNSHLPLSPTKLPEDLNRLCRDAGAGGDVCQLTATVGIALRALRDGLAQSGARPQVVVVGDHAPPFVALPDRDQYSPVQVPAFILTPR